MAEEMDSVTSSMRETNLNDNSAQARRLDNELTLTTVRQLIALAREQERQWRDAIENNDRFLNDSTLAISLRRSLRQSTSQLLVAAQTMDSIFERTLIRYISSRAQQPSAVPQLLSHFSHEIKTIARGVLDSACDQDDHEWRISEECFNESISKAGTLHTDHYFEYLEQSLYSSPIQPTTEEKRDINRAWTTFWVHVLAQCPRGPTLFWPPEDPPSDIGFADVPRFLFRVFDGKSSGLNNDTVVASEAGRNDLETGLGRIDLLSLERRDAAERLCVHLNKPCFSGHDFDNLVSWSSSLLFVIQYAIWRCHEGGTPAAEVKICTVDTTEFPRGQFVRDNWLIRRLHDANDGNRAMDNLIRHAAMGRNTGEYLSQGTVRHKDRSCLVSLDWLDQTTLFTLYPELDHADGREEWNGRVRELRSLWETEGTTTMWEVRRASSIATYCFPGLDAFSITLLLLTFKRRNLGNSSTVGPSSSGRNYATYGPEDVQRYMRAMEPFQPQNPRARLAMNMALDRNGEEILGKVFECSDSP